MDSLPSGDGREASPVASPSPAFAPSVLPTAGELEAEAQAKLSNAFKKNTRKSAASVLHEYLQAQTAADSSSSACDEAGSAAGTDRPANASAWEKRFTLMNLPIAFAEKTPDH